MRAGKRQKSRSSCVWTSVPTTSSTPAKQRRFNWYSQKHSCRGVSRCWLVLLLEKMTRLILWIVLATSPDIAIAESPRSVVRVVTGGGSKSRPDDCLLTIVGPGIKQPGPYPGYGGFVGWVSPIRLKNGDSPGSGTSFLPCCPASSGAILNSTFIGAIMKKRRKV